MSDKCPICKNSIYLERGAKGSQGTDENGDPYPFWTDDPILTPQGLSGDSFTGTDPIRWIHIKELQDYYSALESDLGVASTTFSTINRTIPVRHVHIEELRISVEKCLDSIGLTLSDYFKYNRLGEDIGRTQSEWTDTNRTTIPLLPSSVPVRAIHIEELRIGIYAEDLWHEQWSTTNDFRVWIDGAQSTAPIQENYTASVINPVVLIDVEDLIWSGDEQGLDGYNNELSEVSYQLGISNTYYRSGSLNVRIGDGLFYDPKCHAYGGVSFQNGTHTNNVPSSVTWNLKWGFSPSSIVTPPIWLKQDEAEKSCNITTEATNAEASHVTAGFAGAISLVQRSVVYLYLQFYCVLISGPAFIRELTIGTKSGDVTEVDGHAIDSYNIFHTGDIDDTYNLVDLFKTYYLSDWDLCKHVSLQSFTYGFDCGVSATYPSITTPEMYVSLDADLRVDSIKIHR